MLPHVSLFYASCGHYGLDLRFELVVLCETHRFSFFFLTQQQVCDSLLIARSLCYCFFFYLLRRRMIYSSCLPFSLADHFGGRLHMGFVKVRERLKELEVRAVWLLSFF